MSDAVTRASARPEDDSPVHHLTTRQRRILEAIDDYQRVTGEACSASYLGRRFSLHPSTIQEHLEVLYRKGWLRAPNAPAWLKRSFR